MSSKRTSGLRYAAISTAGHFTVDGYGNFLPPLLPLLVPTLGLSLLAVGSLASILGLSTSLIQPLFGLWADRIGGRWMVAASTLLAGVFLSLMGLATSYLGLALLLILGGIGVAAFHPLGAAMAGKAGYRRAGLGMSVFTAAGTAGFAASPVIVTFVADRWGLGSVSWLMLPGLVMSVLFFRYAPAMEGASQGKHLSVVLTELRTQARHLALVVAIVVIRAVVSVGLITFLPLLLRDRHTPVPVIGTALSAYLFCGAVGGLVGGHLSDRFGRKRILLLSLVLPVPLLCLLPGLEGALLTVSLGLVGFLLLSSVPVNVLMAQELAPGSSATVSSLAMGFGWGLGSIILTPFGVISEAWGLQGSLTMLGCVPLLGAFCVPFIRSEPQTDGSGPAPAAR